MAETPTSASNGENENNNFSKATQGKSPLESMSKDDLLKQVKKQLVLLQKLKSKCDEYDKKCSSLKEQLQIRNEEASTNSQLREINIHLEANLKRIKDENEMYIKKKREMADELECRQMKEESLSVALKQMQTELIKLSSDNEMFISQNNKLTEELKNFQELTLSHNELKEKLNALNQLNMNTTRERDEFKLLLDELTGEHKFFSSQSIQEKQEMQIKIEQLEKNKESLLEEINQYKYIDENLRKAIKEKESIELLAKEIEEENDKLREKLDQSLEDNEKLKKDLLSISNDENSRSERYVNNETQFSDGEDDNDLHSELLQDLYSQINVLEMDLQNAVKERDQLLFQEEREQKDCMMLQDRVHILETEVDDLKSKLESSEFEIEELRARLEESELENNQENRHHVSIQDQEIQTDTLQKESWLLDSFTNDKIVTKGDILDSDDAAEKSHTKKDGENSGKLQTEAALEQILLAKCSKEEFIEDPSALKEMINEINVLINEKTFNEHDDCDMQLHVWLNNIHNILLQYKDKNEKLQSHLVSKENELLQISDNFSIQKKELDGVTEKINSLESELQLYKEKIDEITQEKQSVEEHFTRLKQMDLKHEEQLFEQSFEIKNLTDKLEERNKQLNSLYEEIEQNKQELDSANQLIAEMTTEKTSLEENIENLKCELNDLQTKSQSETVSLHKTNEDLRSSLLTLEGLQHEKTEQISCLEKRACHLQNELDTLSLTHNRQLELFHKMQWKFFSAMKEIQKNIHMLKMVQSDEFYSSCDQECSYDHFSQFDDETKIAEIFKVSNKIKETLSFHQKEKEKEIGKEQDKESELLKNIHHLTNQNAEHEEKLGILKDTEISLRKEIEKMKIKYDEVVSEKEELLHRLQTNDHLAEDLKVLKIKCDDLTDQLTKSQDERIVNEKKLEKITLDLANDRSTLADLQAVNDQLQSELQCLGEDKKALELCKTELDLKLASLLENFHDKEKSVKELKMEMEQHLSHQHGLEQQLQKEKELHSVTLKKLDSLQKEVKQQSLMNLEFADYDRLVADLNQQIEDKNGTIKKITEDLQQQSDLVSSLRTQLEQAETQFDQSENRGNKLKILLVKAKKELSEAKRNEVELHAAEAKLQAEIESRQQTVESMKVENAELLSQFQNLQESLRITKDAHQRTIHTLELQINALKTQKNDIEEDYKKCRTDYENYKIRVHSVLKQQKDKTSQKIIMEEEQKEKEYLEKIIEQLKLKLQEANDQLQATTIETNTSQEEYDRLLLSHNNFVQDIQKKEIAWKEELEHLMQKYNACRQEHLDTVRALQQQNEMLRLNFKEQLQSLKEEHKKALEREHLHLGTVKAELSRLQEQQKISPIRELEIFDVSNIERQEGEGSENTEPVFGSKQHIDSISSLVSFEQLLNSETKSTSSQVSGSQPETEALEQQLAATVKKLQHITEVLNESEASNIRLTEQMQVLKDEIRRIERNQERKEHASNLEYLKNIVLKFLTLEGDDERVHLIPVLTMMLQLSPEERNKLIALTKGDTNKSKPETDGARWGNYLPRWSGLV